MIQEFGSAATPARARPSVCTPGDISALNDQTVLLPLYAVATGTGSGGKYYIKGFAAFHVTGYRFASDTWKSAGCANKSLRGYFVKFVSLSKPSNSEVPPITVPSVVRLTIGAPSVMKSRLLAGLAAVVLAIVGAVLVVSYAQGADARAVQNLDPVTVLVVQKAFPAGTPVASLQPSSPPRNCPARPSPSRRCRISTARPARSPPSNCCPVSSWWPSVWLQPEELKTSGAVQIPKGLQEVSFQLEPQRVVGGRLAAGDHIGIFINLKNGGLEAKPDKQTTQLTVHKVLVTAVQRAPATTPRCPSRQPVVPRLRLRTRHSHRLMIITVAVNDVDATKIVYASNFSDAASIWLSREPLDATDSGRPGIITRPEVYK